MDLLPNSVTTRLCFGRGTKIAVWRDDDNGARPHSSLAYRTPGEFAAQWRRPSSSLHSVLHPEPSVKAILTAPSRAALTAEPAAANHPPRGREEIPTEYLHDNFRCLLDQSEGGGERFARNNVITEGFHTKMAVLQRQAYGFRNYRLRIR